MVWWNPLANAAQPFLPTSSSGLIVSLLLTPAVGGLLVTLLRGKRASGVITVASTLLVLVQTLVLIGDIIAEKQLSAFGGLFYLDALGALILLPIAGVGFVSAIYSINYMGRQHERGLLDDKHITRYYQLFNAFMLTMLLVPVSNNMGLMWVAIEATTLVSVLLIMLYTKEGAIEAAWKYLIIATVGLSLALFGIVLFSYSEATAAPSSVSSAAASSLNWTYVSANAASLNPEVVKFAFIFVLIGFGTKAGLAPMHTWLPDAHSEAPTPVSALLSGVLLNCSIYAILRFDIVTSGTLGSAFSSQMLVILGAVSMGVAAASIYFAKDMKRMLAYSSVEHMGIITLGVGFGGFLGIFGALFQIINHAIAKSLMFFASGTISQKYDTKAISEIKGILKIMPVTGVVFLIGGLTIVGMPPFNIFAGEFLILTSGFSGGQFLAISLFLTFSVVIFAGLMKHLIPMVFGNPKGPGRETAIDANPKRDDMGWLAVVPMAALAAFLIMLGVYLPQPLETLIRDAVQVFNQG
ncbi:MAG: hydrogenase 4 subunit F [Nitrososphaerota archaeon]|nr:hydrogenase 4 subunit F [Nitrososphaerota archaeon]